MFDAEPQYQLLEFWKRAEGTFPIIAEMAREFLAIPASGVGVERLFNQARDICTYRRHSLKPETLRLLVMLMCMDSFNLKEEYRLSAVANDLEDEWELVPEDNCDMNDDDNQSVYAISENDETFSLQEDDQYVFDLPENDIFDLQNNDIFDLPGNDAFGLHNNDMFELPDDLEAAPQDSAAQQSIPTAVISDTVILTTPLAQRQRQTTHQSVISAGSITRQNTAALQSTPRRSARSTQKS